MLVCNRSAAPHLRTIGPAYVHEVRSADPLVQICGTAERLQSGGFGTLVTAPVNGYVGLPSISTQVLSETANVASKRLAVSASEIHKLITSLEAICRVEIILLTTIHIALNIRERYNFSWYDSLIVATALEAGCDTLYSEDMQDGQEIEGRLRIVNPFV